MYTGNKGKAQSQWSKLKSELSVSEMSALSGYSKAGMDCSVTIGDEIQPKDLLCYANVQPGAFTAEGKLEPQRLAKFLETAQEKYECTVKVFCVRRVR